MSRSMMGIARDLEKQRPIYRAITKVMKWYEGNPHTPAGTANKIKELHSRADVARAAMDRRHAEELMPILKTVEKAREDGRKLAEVHRKEKEDMTIGFAQVEIDLLQGRVTELPDHVRPIDSRARLLMTLIRGLRWVAEKLVKMRKRKDVHSQAESEV